MATDPFPAHGPVSRDELERYAAGRLNAADQHRVEQQLEQDPLLREAVEGLRMPGAPAGLKALDAMRPGPQGTTAGPWLVGALLLVGLTAAVLLVREEPHRAPSPMAVAAPEHPYKADSAIALVVGEVAKAEPLPPPQQIGHAPAPPPPVVRDTALVPALVPVLDTVLVRTAPVPAPGASSPDHGTTPRNNRRLAFVHDLKLVDPAELYARDPLITDPGGVPAGFADEADRRARTEAPRTMRYLDFMDEALGRFVRDDHSGCLRDLLFLMGQYPRDINARFYAGLCCYNLGLPERARGYLQAVVDDPVDTFREEATWYLALSIERSEGREAALPLFRQVAENGGHYAAQARRKLEP